MGPLHGREDRRARRHRAGPVRGNVAVRHGRRGRAGRAGRGRSSGRTATERFTFDARGRRAIAVDLKNPDGVETVLRLVEQADALIEGFRPGVTERLGLGPDECLARNPRLVYGRMTGWGQDGPLAHAAGHDINYISLAGALAHFGRVGRPPTPPLNMVGDYGGGGMFLAFGVVCAILEARTLRAGPGGRRGDGRRRRLPHGRDLGHARHGPLAARSAARTCSTPARRSTTCTRPADGKWVSIGAIEPQFYAELLELTGVRPRRPARRRWTAPAGPRCTSGSPRCSARRRATSGASCSRGPTCASRRCCR